MNFGDSDSDDEDDSYHGTRQTQDKKKPLERQQLFPSVKSSSEPFVKPDPPVSFKPEPKMNADPKPTVNKTKASAIKQKHQNVHKMGKATVKPIKSRSEKGDRSVEVKERQPRHLPGLKIAPSSNQSISPKRVRSRSRSPDPITQPIESSIGRVVFTPPKIARPVPRKAPIEETNNHVRHQHKTMENSNEVPSVINPPVHSDGNSFQAAYTPEGGKNQMYPSDAVAQMNSLSVSERTCIRLFGISYQEIVSKLLMESQILTEAESRMVLLILAEQDPKLPQVQQRMLDAIVTIERTGITKGSVSRFRKELASVASKVSQKGNMEDELEAFDVKLTPVRETKDDKRDSPGADLEVGDNIEEVTGIETLNKLKVEEQALLKQNVDREHLVPVLSQVMHKVAAHLAESPPSGRRQVILVGSGAYNPIHKLHLRMLYIARKYLEERTEYDVLGGLVSPAHATDVRSRYRQQPLEIIPPKHRLAMARCAVGDSTWLTVDPWEITRKRVLDYLSVLEHVTHLLDLCFPGLSVKVIYLCNSDVLMKLCPESLRSRGFGCLCVCRPQETDRLLEHMGSRWKHVAYVVEDAAILSRELEATTSTRVRTCAINNKMKDVSSMVGQPVARYITKHSLGAKMGGKERWTDADKEFQLFSGLEISDMGYESEARIRHRCEVPSSALKHNHRFDVL